MTKLKDYETPAVYRHEMFVEGVLCASPAGDNENYGGDPFFGGESDNPIF